MSEKKGKRPEPTSKFVIKIVLICAMLLAIGGVSLWLYYSQTPSSWEDQVSRDPSSVKMTRPKGCFQSTATQQAHNTTSVTKSHHGPQLSTSASKNSTTKVGCSPQKTRTRKITSPIRSVKSIAKWVIIGRQGISATPHLNGCGKMGKTPQSPATSKLRVLTRLGCAWMCRRVQMRRADLWPSGWKSHAISPVILSVRPRVSQPLTHPRDMGQLNNELSSQNYTKHTTTTEWKNQWVTWGLGQSTIYFQSNHSSN